MAERLFYTKEEYEAAARVNILAYLKSIGHEVKDEGGRYVRSRQHSSLVIRKDDGAWSWNRQNESGRNPVSLVTKLLQADMAYDAKTAYLLAVKSLAEFSGYQADGAVVYQESSPAAARDEMDRKEKSIKTVIQKEEVLEKAMRTRYYFDIRSILDTMQKDGLIKPDGTLYSLFLRSRAEGKDCYRTVCDILEYREELQKPEKATDYKRAIAYLCQTRKIDYDLVKKLIGEKKIFQQAETGNVGFVAYDTKGEAKHIFLRGTLSEKSFKMDAKGSDKSYAFSFGGNEASKRVYVFEAAIDALSHATLAKRCGQETNDYRMTLNGVSLEGLHRFLSEHENVQEICICTDNDEAGEACADQIKETLGTSYHLFRQKAPQGKDWNEYLVHYATEFPPPREPKSADLALEM